MGAYFARRFLLMIPTFLGITFLVFLVTRFVPGGPIEQAILQMEMGAAAGAAGARGAEVGAGSRIPPEAMAELEKRYGFDKPTPVAYANWLWDTVRLDLGKSYKYNTPVLEVISRRFPVSIYFGLLGFTLAYLVCIPLGVAKAVRHGSPFDVATSFAVFAGYSVPGWALGALLLVWLGGGQFLDWIPLGGFRSPDWRGFQYDSGHTRRRAIPGLPGTWSGIEYDFVQGGEGLTIPGLPDEVRGCLDGT